MQLKKVNLIITALLIINTCFAQKSIEKSGSYTLRIEKNWSEDFAVNKAREKAKINAIENAFGTVINQENYIYVKDEKSKDSTKTDMVFTSIANVLVNGEWIKDLSENIEFFDSTGYHFVTVYVKGRIRELTKIPFTPETTTLSCTNKKCATQSFNSGQELIVYFKAASNGFVTIYLDDTKMAQKLLPYSKNIDAAAFEVKADKEYFFFSQVDNKQNEVDEVELFTTSAMEQNRLIILFSPNNFNKPLLNNTKTETIDGSKYTMPAAMEITKFQTWLQLLRSYNRTIEQKNIDITIKK